MQALFLLAAALFGALALRRRTPTSAPPLPAPKPAPRILASATAPIVAINNANDFVVQIVPGDMGEVSMLAMNNSVPLDAWHDLVLQAPDGGMILSATSSNEWVIWSWAGSEMLATVPMGVPSNPGATVITIVWLDITRAQQKSKLTVNAY